MEGARHEGGIPESGPRVGAGLWIAVVSVLASLGQSRRDETQPIDFRPRRVVSGSAARRAPMRALTPISRKSGVLNEF